MILYDHPLSSYGQKAKFVLREKGIAFERSLPKHFGTGREDTGFFAASSRSEVPKAWLTERLGSGPWFGGERFGWAATAAAAMATRSVHYGLGPHQGSTLGRWRERL